MQDHIILSDSAVSVVQNKFARPLSNNLCTKIITLCQYAQLEGGHSIVKLHII